MKTHFLLVLEVSLHWPLEGVIGRHHVFGQTALCPTQFPGAKSGPVTNAGTRHLKLDT